MRVLFDLALMVFLLVWMMLALIGIESNGLSGAGARRLWSGTFFLAVIVVYRWLLLSTPLLDGIGRITSWYGRAVAKMLDAAIMALPAYFEQLLAFTARVLQVLSEAFATVVSAGLWNGIDGISEWFSRRAASRRRKIAPKRTKEGR